MQSQDFLDSILKKKWLSSNTVRDGLIACMTRTLARYAAEKPLSDLGLQEQAGSADAQRRDRIIYDTVLKASRNAFDHMKIDDEYPNKEQLGEVRSIMEQALGFAELDRRDPSLSAEYRAVADALFDKLE